MFEWQRSSQEDSDVPPYQKLLDFLDLRAQASESLLNETTKLKSKTTEHHYRRSNHRPSIATCIGTTTTTDQTRNLCPVCKQKHPLYCCAKFKSLPHQEKISVLRTNNLCINCLRSGHFIKECKSSHRCQVCQRPHHTLQ